MISLIKINFNWDIILVFSQKNYDFTFISIYFINDKKEQQFFYINLIN